MSQHLGTLFTVSEFQEVLSQFITENVERDDVETIIGMAYCDDEDDKIIITVIATGFEMAWHGNC